VVSWSEFLAADPEVRVRFQALTDFLERGPLSLVSTTEELLGRKSSGSGLESREYGRRDPSLPVKNVPLSDHPIVIFGILIRLIRFGVVSSKNEKSEECVSVPSHGQRLVQGAAVSGYKVPLTTFFHSLRSCFIVHKIVIYF
jgi:hypothetical protein